MPKIGLIARMDKSGLGQGQTKRLARLINPDYLMVIDSSGFNGAKQYPEWYDGYPIVDMGGFPSDDEVRHFLKFVDIAITCETFYNRNFTILAKQMNVKTIIIANPEFFDWFTPAYQYVTRPDKVVVPSHWMMDRMRPFDPQYLPTPIFEDEFAQARTTNLKRTGKPRYLFMNGKSAAFDRAGLKCLYEALELSTGDFEVVVKAQGDIVKHPDPRLTYDFSNPDEQYKLYDNFDLMIHPRRYGGQSLPMTEALSSALPVIMPNIDPNNKVLPINWLVGAKKIGQFMTRTEVDIYHTDKYHLWTFFDMPMLHGEKAKALTLAKEYEAENLRPAYEELLK